MKISSVTSDEALGLLRRVALGQAVPRMKNSDQHWNDQTVELVVEGWKLVIFTDAARWSHIASMTSPDGRLGESRSWCSDSEFSQQPEDRLYREDSNAVSRMFTAFRNAA
jgi:hypothetical protein